MSDKSRSSRSYTDRTLKILWGRAAGRCALPECRIALLVDATNYDPTVVIGDIAHIEASSDRGPRANAAIAGHARDEYENLILLCKNCHARLDGQKRSNTVEAIRQLKSDHEAWVRESLPERGGTTLGWRVLLLQGQPPIDAQCAVDALVPDYPSSPPVAITVAPTQANWNTAFAEMTRQVAASMDSNDPFDARFAVFPLAPVSACIALGYLLTNRPRVRLFQFHRDQQAWAWPRTAATPTALEIAGLPQQECGDPGQVAICFHLSARIRRENLPAALQRPLAVVDVSIPSPTTAWLQDTAQLDELGRVARTIFETLSHACPRATAWHVFYAGPAPGAVKVGQQLNPTMSPPVQLYEFIRASASPYSASILLGGAA